MRQGNGGAAPCVRNVSVELHVPRTHAGESFVQYARGHTDGKAYAIKFFLNHSRFVAEATLLAAFQPYLRASLSHDLAVAAEAAADDAPASAPPAADFLPRAHTIGDTAKGKLTDPRGRPLPSCIVVDKGLSLHDWSDNTPPDLFTALAVRFHSRVCMTTVTASTPATTQ